jgi:LAO/AO transport system kinase
MHHGRLMEAVAATGRVEDQTDAPPPWRPLIHKTVATRREGIEELAGAILAHRAYLEESGGLARSERERAAAEIETIIQQVSLRQVLARTDRAQLARLIDRVVQRELDPYAASQRLLAGSDPSGRDSRP